MLHSILGKEIMSEWYEFRNLHTYLVVPFAASVRPSTCVLCKHRCTVLLVLHLYKHMAFNGANSI